MEDDINEELIIAQFTEQCNSFYQEFEDDLSSVIHQLEEKNKTLTSIRKDVESTRQKKEERRKELSKVDMEEKTLWAEIESMEREIEDAKRIINVLEDEVSKLAVEKKRMTQEQDETKENAMRTFQALVAAMAYHKLYVKCYIDLDELGVSAFALHFFHDENEKKSLNERNYCVTLNYNGEYWEVLTMKPSLPCQEEISENLKETKNIVGFVAHVHDLYLKDRKSQDKKRMK